MNDPGGGQLTGCRGHGLAGGQAVGIPIGSDPAAFLQNRPAAGAVNSAVDATAAEQGMVGGIDDGVHLLFRDVALDHMDAQLQHLWIQAGTTGEFSAAIGTVPVEGRRLSLFTAFGKGARREGCSSAGCSDGWSARSASVEALVVLVGSLVIGQRFPRVMGIKPPTCAKPEMRTLVGSSTS